MNCGNVLRRRRSIREAHGTATERATIWPTISAALVRRTARRLQCVGTGTTTSTRSAVSLGRNLRRASRASVMATDSPFACFVSRMSRRRRPSYGPSETQVSKDNGRSRHAGQRSDVGCPTGNRSPHRRQVGPSKSGSSCRQAGHKRTPSPTSDRPVLHATQPGGKPISSTALNTDRVPRRIQRWVVSIGFCTMHSTGPAIRTLETSGSMPDYSCTAYPVQASVGVLLT